MSWEIENLLSALEVQEQEMATWIYRVNPKKFDVNGCLAKAPERVAWVVTHSKKVLSPGDQVFIWRSRSDGKSGIIGECIVDSHVMEMSADSLTTQFSRDNSPSSVRDRMWLRLARIAEEDGVLTEEEIVQHELLKKVGPLAFRNGTLYKVSAEQREALNYLWSSPTKLRVAT